MPFWASRKGTTMRVETLLSPGVITGGYQLRTEAAKAISRAEITARSTPGGKTRMAKQLQDFFTDCATKMNDIVDGTAPTWAGATATATSATVLTIVFAENMDTSVVPAMSAFSIAGDTFTSAVWTNATTFTITGTGFAAAETLTYTQPAVNGLRDVAGNLVASGTKELV